MHIVYTYAYAKPAIKLNQNFYILYMWGKHLSRAQYNTFLVLSLFINLCTSWRRCILPTDDDATTSCNWCIWACKVWTSKAWLSWEACIRAWRAWISLAYKDMFQTQLYIDRRFHIATFTRTTKGCRNAEEPQLLRSLDKTVCKLCGHGYGSTENLRETMGPIQNINYIKGNLMIVLLTSAQKLLKGCYQVLLVACKDYSQIEKAGPTLSTFALVSHSLLPCTIW